MTKNIKQQLIEIDWNNHDSVIEFYENNLLYFNNYNTVTNKDSIIEMIDLKLQYCNSLIWKERNKKALPILTHIDILLQRINDDELFKNYSANSTYLEGMIKGNLKKYDESYEIFKKLVKEDPENDSYKEWYLYSKTHLVLKQSLIVTYIGLGIVVLDMILDLSIDYEMNQKIVLLGFIMLFGGTLFPKIRKYWIKYHEKLN